MNGELLRLVDSIHRDKDIDKEIVFKCLEDALLSAARKKYGQRDSIMVTIDRETGNILAFDGDTPLSPAEFGRIAAQTAKQVIIQKVKEAESEVVFQEWEAKIHDVVNGTVQRVEGPTVIINLGKIEGILPKREQVRDDTYRPGERLKFYVIDVKREGQKVKVLLSRTHPDLIKRLFELEVPEVADRIIEIKGLAREPGSRTKIAVISSDSRVDCVGACVGVRGSRIKNIVAELGGEKIDIVPWNDQPEMFIAKALSPAEVFSITLNYGLNRAKVVVPDDQLSLAIGKKGQNVRLAAKLTHWDIDVMTKEESDRLADETRHYLSRVQNVSEDTLGRVVRLGYTLTDLAESTVESLASLKGMTEDEAKILIEAARQIMFEGGLQQPAAEGEAAAEAEAPSAEGAEEPAEGEAEPAAEAEGEAGPAADEAEEPSEEAAGKQEPAAEPADEAEPAQDSGDEPQPAEEAEPQQGEPDETPAKHDDSH
ncbi:MAG TPA: transcription termination factor NusA [Planctomycetota bacterium]|nr:transcription termination factor NusA [Planctomycetota bacterium]